MSTEAVTDRARKRGHADVGHADVGRARSAMRHVCVGLLLGCAAACASPAKQTFERPTSTEGSSGVPRLDASMSPSQEQPPLDAFTPRDTFTPRVEAGPTLVVWQHNISFESSPVAAETALLHAMNDFEPPPDIFLFQECSRVCLCGESGVFDRATGACTSIEGPSVARALERVTSARRRAYTFRINQGRVVGFRTDRFDQIGKQLDWGATAAGKADTHTPCPSVKVGAQLSVALDDKLATPRRQILASTGHWFVSRDCACGQVHALEASWKTAPTLRRADGSDAASYVDLHINSGDWNAEPTTGLPLAYQSGGSCGGFDLGGERHEDTGGNEFTFCQGKGGVSQPATCTNKKKVDYLWARAYNESGITWTGSADTTANYFNDHRAVRSVFTY